MYQAPSLRRLGSLSELTLYTGNPSGSDTLYGYPNGDPIQSAGYSVDACVEPGNVQIPCP